MRDEIQVLNRQRKKDPLTVLEGIKDSYTNQVKQWTKWMRAEGKGIEPEHIIDYFYMLQASNFSAGTIRNKRQAVKTRLRQMYNQRVEELERAIKEKELSGVEHADLLVDIGELKHATNEQAELEGLFRKLDQKIKAPKVNTYEVRRDLVVNEVEYINLLDACRSARQKAFIMFLWETGCRIDELTGAKIANCKLVGDDISVSVLGKASAKAGKKQRDVRITIGLFEFIKETFHGSEYLFETQPFRDKEGGKRFSNEYISNQIKKIGKRIGKNISAHILRHSFGTKMVLAHPEKIKQISVYMGHADVGTTLNFYMNASLSHEELFKDTHSCGEICI